jgi:hypothetical protein
VTASLSAGGAIVVATAAAQHSKRQADAHTVNIALADPASASRSTSQDQPTPDRRSSKTTEERLQDLERRLDLLFNLAGAAAHARMPRFDPNSPTLDRVEAMVDFMLGRHERVETTKASIPHDSAVARHSQRPSNTKHITEPTPPASRLEPLSRLATTRREEPVVRESGREIRELEARLAMALKESERAEQLHRQASIETAVRDEILGKVDLAMATLRGIGDDLADEIDRCALETKKKLAERDRVRAQMEVSNTVIARNNRLNSRDAGTISTEDVARAAAERQACAVEVQVKEIEVEESKLRYRQLESRSERVKQILKWAERTRTGTASNAPTQGAGEQRRP